MSRKSQRQIDLLAALLAYHAPRTFEQIVDDVPDYQQSAGPSLKRLFERDKKDLRELGVPVETVGGEGSEDSAYRLRTKDFYLPYLTLMNSLEWSKPRKVDKTGYHALPVLAFEPEELVAIARAGHRVRSMGDPGLAGEVDSALRKLAFDLPVDSAMPASEEHLHVRGKRAGAAELDALSAALLLRKRVKFWYQGMNSGSREQRTVEPYGLFFLNAHWYLAAYDTDREALRNFRVSRIEQVKRLDSKDASPDYQVPDDFSLREHARSRQAWEIGDGDGVHAVVEFSGGSGVARAGAELGEPVQGRPNCRTFRVRRQDTFARWILSFAGEAMPLEPPELVQAVRDLAAATRAVYAEAES